MEATDNSRYDALMDKEAGFDELNQTAREQANQRIWQMILGGAGLGLGLRGAFGLGELMMPRGRGYQASPTSQTVDLMLPQPQDEEEKYGMDKEAIEWKGPGDLFDPKFYAQFTQPLFDKDWGPVGNYIKGDQSTHYGGVPATWAVGVPAGALALAGGWKGMDALMKRRREAALEAEEESYKNEYREILEKLQKRGSANDFLEEELDELADAYAEAQTHEKQAAFGWDELKQKASNIGGFGTGAYMAYATLAALLSGKLSYDYFKRRGRRNVAQEAMKRRSKERTGGVAPIQFRPGAQDLV